MPVHTHGKKFIVEIEQDGIEGSFCQNGFEVEIKNEGGGPFLALTGRNLEPDDEYSEHTVWIVREDIEPFCNTLLKILDDAIIVDDRGSHGG